MGLRLDEVQVHGLAPTTCRSFRTRTSSPTCGASPTETRRPSSPASPFASSSLGMYIHVCMSMRVASAHGLFVNFGRDGSVCCCSGTSGGERKLMPTIADKMDRRSLLYSLLITVMSQAVPGLDKGKAMYLYFVKAESRTPGGLPARPVLTSFYRRSWRGGLG
jgi:hypothetical protein